MARVILVQMSADEQATNASLVPVPAPSISVGTLRALQEAIHDEGEGDPTGSFLTALSEARLQVGTTAEGQQVVAGLVQDFLDRQYAKVTAESVMALRRDVLYDEASGGEYSYRSSAVDQLYPSEWKVSTRAVAGRRSGHEQIQSRKRDRARWMPATVTEREDLRALQEIDADRLPSQAEYVIENSYAPAIVLALHFATASEYTGQSHPNELLEMIRKFGGSEFDKDRQSLWKFLNKNMHIPLLARRKSDATYIPTLTQPQAEHMQNYERVLELVQALLKSEQGEACIEAANSMLDSLLETSDIRMLNLGLSINYFITEFLKDPESFDIGYWQKMRKA